MCQSVCVSVDLLRINLKFLNIHNYWLAQLLYVSLVSGLELKTCRMHIKMLRNSSKKSWGRHSFQGLQQNSLFSNWNCYCCYDYYVSNSVIRLVVKFCWSAKIIFQVFCFFQKKVKGELALAYESYSGGILIIILIEILNNYCFILYWLATISHLGWHPPHLVDNTDTQYLREQHWQQCWCLRFYFFLCLSMSVSVSRCVCASV